MSMEYTCRHTIMDGLVVEFGFVSASRNAVVIHDEPTIRTSEVKAKTVRWILKAWRAHEILKQHDPREAEFNALWLARELERSENLASQLDLSEEDAK